MFTKKIIFKFQSIMIFLTLLILTFSTVGVTPAYAAPLIVTNTNDSGAGSLRQTIADASSGSTITFDPSLSGATIRLASELTLSKNVNIDGSALASKITLSGDTDGNGVGNVGVIYITFDVIVGLNSLIITKGYTTSGGGIRNYGPLLTITNSIITGNSSIYEGGGIFLSGPGGQETIIKNSTISGNKSETGGGGIFSYNGTLTITNSTISGNSAIGDEVNEGGGSGGGIFNQNNSLIIINSTISGNNAENNGGAIFNFQDGTANVYNSSIVYNGANGDADADGLAGGVYVMSGGVFNQRNTILAGNSVSGAPVYDDCHGTVNSYGQNLIGALGLTTSGSCTKNGSWTQLNDLNLLGILQNNGGPTKTVALLAGSNAIDTADSIFGCVNSSGVVLPADQRGYGRAGVRCDIGAYEFNGNVPPAVSSITRVNTNPTNVATVSFTVNFSEVVTGVNIGDFDLRTSGVSGAAVSGVSGSGSSYTVSVNTGTGNGTIRMDVVSDGSIKDGGGNPLAADFTSGEAYTVLRSATFADVPLTYWASGYIERLFNAGITGGCGTGIYCPDNTVTRAQMAIFLLKGIHGSSYAPPAVNGNTGFGDVAADYWAAAWIKQLAAEGITSGCGGGNYCPDSTVTRAQMAVFLLKAKNGSSYSPPVVGSSTGFNDVAVNYWAAPFIKQLVTDGITSGCGAGNYCPDDSVTRAQMAIFLVRTFNLP